MKDKYFRFKLLLHINDQNTSARWVEVKLIIFLLRLGQSHNKNVICHFN